MTPYTTIDLFCGVGGLTHGLQKAGIPVTAGIDIDPQCQHPYEHNNQTAFHQVDIRNLAGNDLNEMWGNTPIKILAGCPPCQPFSSYTRTSAKHGAAHQDYDLLDEYTRLINETNPDIVVMENVEGVTNTPAFKHLLHALGNKHVSMNVLNAADYGLPQNRRRFILIASDLGVPFMPSTDLFPRQTVRTAIAHLPPIQPGETHPSDPLHTAANLSPINQQRIRHSKPGGTFHDWPPRLRTSSQKRPTAAASTYARMEWDKPAPTLTTQFTGFGNGRYGHPEQHRAISLREGAILQGFPEEYEFHEGELRISHVRRLIGNSVPPVFGEVLGWVIANHMYSDYGLPPIEVEQPGLFDV